MPDAKITALTAISVIDPAVDPLPIVDVSDTAMAASGTTKKITINQLLGASGTATLASATITGNLTVDTNTLFVDAANNRVGVGTATPQQTFEVVGGTAGINTIFNTGSAGDSRFELRNNNVRSGYVYWDTAEVRLFADTSRALTFYQNGTLGMTLNSTGLGVGASPANDKILSLGSMGILLAGATSDFSFRNSGGTAIQRLRYTDATGTLTIGSATGTAFPVELGGNTTTRAVTIDASSNVGVGVTPITGHRISSVGPIGLSGGPNSFLAVGNYCSIYYTDGSGSSFPFLEYGNLVIHPRDARNVVIATAPSAGSNTSRIVVKTNGQVRFVPLAADPSGAEAGDVYYNSVSNRLKYYNGTAWTLI